MTLLVCDCLLNPCMRCKVCDSLFRCIISDVCASSFLHDLEILCICCPPLQIKCRYKSVHQTLFHLSASHLIWSAMMLHQGTFQAHHTWWTRWSGTKMDRKWPCVKICSCCKTLHFTLTPCCRLMLDSTSVRLMCLRYQRQEFSAWAIYSAVSIHEVKNSLREENECIILYILEWTF